MTTDLRAFRILIAITYAVLLVVMAHNLQFPYLMFDEAVQFWISKGLNPDSEPLSTPSGVGAVVENNKYYNMDPGGFGILLHWWAAISNNYVWLRMLPFLIYIGVVFAFIYLAYKWTKNKNVALLIGFIPILYPMLLTMAFEIRAYSMETLGVALCIASLEHFKKKLHYSNLFAWGCVFAVFMTSRYSLVLVAFATSIYVIFLVATARMTLQSKILALAAYGLPLLAMLQFIYFNALVYQNTNIAPLIYIPYLRDSPELLLKPQALLYMGLMFLLVLALLLRNRYPIIKKYNGLLVISLGVNLLFMLLSFLGMHPWVPAFSFRSNRCISMITLMVLCFAALMGEILLAIFNKPGGRKYYALPLALAAIFAIRWQALLPRFIPLGIKETESSYAIDNNVQIDFVNHPIADRQKIYVDWGNSPFTKYWYEYGPFKGEVGRGYPGKFKFTKTGRHGFYEGAADVDFFKRTKPQADSLQWNAYDLIIAGEAPDAATWKLMPGTNNFWIKK
ncbi:MAG: hypothetical protein EOO03_05205 [Chitinophagaceae bacterium]|nr:MAG: hypothetical protein EOO03_05205 [Chitinophagaceae bacterium]